MKSHLITGCLLLFNCMLYAQQLSGVISCKSSHESLPGAHIKNISRNGASSISNESGRFTVPGVAGDSLEVSFIGFITERFSCPTTSVVVRMNPSYTPMSEVVVTGSRDEEKRAEVPASISSLGPRTIDETKATSLEQVINKATAVYMVDLGNEQHAMAIRQPISYKSMFLYLEDGVPIRASGDFNHNALIEMNMAAVRDIEIVRGPASASYGSDAVGGAINFITRNITPFPTGAFSLETGSTGYKKGAFNYSTTAKGNGLMIAGYGALQRNGWRPHSDMDKLALTAKWSREISRKSSLSFTTSGIGYYSDQTGGIDSLHFFERDYYSPHTFTWRKVNAARAKFSWDHQPDSTKSIKTSLYFRNSIVGQNPFYAIKSTADPLKARGEINEDNLKTYGTHVQAKKTWKKTTLMTGLTGEYSPLRYNAWFIDVVKNESGIFTDFTETDSLLTSYNANIISAGAFVQLCYKPGKKFSFTFSGRQDLLQYDFDNMLKPGSYSGASDQVVTYFQFTPRAGITWLLNTKTGFYANTGYGFAPPVITELFKGVQVPELEPASFVNYEAGGWKSLAGGKGLVEFSLYRMHGEKEIIQIRLPDGSYENQNAGSTLHQGIEYSFRYQVTGDVFVRTGITHMQHLYLDYTERGMDYSGNVMAASPSCIGNGEINWRPRFIYGLRLAAEVQYISPYFMDAENKMIYSGYKLLNLRAGYQHGQFEVWANLINAGNTLYATTVEKTAWSTNYRPGAPRTLTLGVNWKFVNQKTGQS